jgi:flagellar hook-basal body complex protein FliE
MTDAILAVHAIALQPITSTTTTPPSTVPHAISFEQMLRNGIETTSSRVADANRLVTAFAVDDSIPAHQVTFALEEARLSLEMMIQVRNKIIEGYQQIMNMQV